MVDKFLMDFKKGRLKDIIPDNSEYAIANLAAVTANRTVQNLRVTDPKSPFSITIAGGYFLSPPMVDVEYRGPDAVKGLTQGYMRVARDNGRLNIRDWSKEAPPAGWEEISKLRFRRTLPSPVRDGNVSYSFRVDDSYLFGRYVSEALGDKARDKRDGKIICIVPEIAERRPTFLDGMAVTKVSTYGARERFEEDKAKLVDAVEQFGFDAAGLVEPGTSARSGLYNVCLKPMLVDESGLEKFVARALELGLDSRFSMVSRSSKGRSAKMVVGVKREEGKDYVGVNFTAGNNSSRNYNLSKYAAWLLGLDQSIRELPVEYDFRSINPKWREMDDATRERMGEAARIRRERAESFGRALKGVGKGALQVGKWGTVPLWGLFYLAGTGIDRGIKKIDQQIKEERAARRRFYDRVSGQISDLGIDKNRTGYESCVIGVTPEFLDDVKTKGEKKDSGSK